MTNKYIFTANAVVHSRTNTTPTVHDTSDPVVLGLNILSRLDPVMVNIKHSRHNITKFKTTIQAMCYFLS